MQRARIAAAGAAVENKRFLVTGGFGKVNGSLVAHSSAQRFSFANDTWIATAPMFDARAYHTATALRTDAVIGNSNNVLVVGGHDLSTLPSRALRYDPLTGGWTYASMPHSNLQIYAHSATQLEFTGTYRNDVLVAGGYTITGNVTGAVQKYTTVGGDNWWWNFDDKCNQASAWHSATSVFGGVVWAGGEGFGVSQKVTCVWQAQHVHLPGTMAFERTTFAAQWVPYPSPLGSVLVAGGYRTQAAQPVIYDAELYDLN
jgi:Galactose oxidase, central domain